MSDEEELEQEMIISCNACGTTVDYDTPCPNGCDPLGHYLSRCSSPVTLTDEQSDILSSVSLNEACDLIRAFLSEE
jgi:hypothetical protein